MPQSLDDRYRLAFEYANAGMFIIDINGKILEANARACEIFGLAAGSLNGCGVNDLALPEDHHVSMNAIQRLLDRSTDREIFEKRYRHRDGTIVHGLVSVSLVHSSSGAPSYFISQLQDISSLKQVEVDLRVSEERHKLALAASGLGCWDWHISTGLMFLDDRALSMLGYQPMELAPDTRIWEVLAHPEERSIILRAIDAHLSGETPAYEMEHRFRHKDGHWVWIMERGKVISRGSDSAALRMTGTYEDVTSRKRLETESSYLLQQIEHLLKDAVRPQHPPSPRLARDNPRKTDCLTKRQIEVLRLVASGLKSPEIAQTLHITTETVEGHRRDLMRKLEVRSIAALTRLAIQEGIVPN